MRRHTTISGQWAVGSRQLAVDSGWPGGRHLIPNPQSLIPASNSQFLIPLLRFPIPHRSALRLPPSAFTLVELLVVITIIGILAGLVTAAAVRARVHAKNAAITIEIKQLEMACQAYKEKFGEYPPDFSGLNTSMTATIRDASQKAILRHLAKAFPRYQPGITQGGGPTNDWPGFVADVQQGWNIDLTNYPDLLSPMGALTFWLGGKPDWLVDNVNGVAILADTTTKILRSMPVRGFLGFAADPTNPFASELTCPSRIQPFFDFDPSCILYYDKDKNGNKVLGGLLVWPTSACDKNSSPIVYFRASNSAYYFDGSTTDVRYCQFVYPAIDTRLSTSTLYTWINPKSFQIFSSGLDMTYGVLTSATGTPLQYPAGTNYAQGTYDDITNFSGGKLEDAIP